MKTNTRYDRFKRQRAELSDALAALADSVGQDQDPHYVIGYITEFVADHLAHQSGAQREEFVNKVAAARGAWAARLRTARSPKD